MRRNNRTTAWRLYEQGRAYHNRLTPNQYRLVETNNEFFAGNQWLNLPDTPASRGLPRPVFNILKRVASLFIASLTSSGVTIRCEPLAYYNASGRADPDADAARFANAELANLLEKLKFEYRLRDALFDGARTGDYCAHFWFDPEALPYGGAFGAHRGEIRMELVDGIDVMFGNPNVSEVEKQPYILLVGRDTVENLREEAAWHRRAASAERNGELIQPDAETDDFPGTGGRTELDGGTAEENGKALYVLLYTKREREVPVTKPDGTPLTDDDGVPVTRRELTVHVTKATKTAVIYEDVDTGLSLYPVAWGNWEKQKNQYHGRALVTGLIPNQIFINTMFASAMRHLQLMAFPRTVYNADLISAWTNEVGQAIGVRGLQPGQSLSSVAAHVQGAEMSGQLFALIDKTMAYTKECLGATDAQMGTARPDNTSALMVLQTNAEVPLENIRSGLHEWVEDIGAILLDMMGTCYGRRPVVMERTFEEAVTDGAGQPSIDPVSGLIRTRTVTRKALGEYDFSAFKNLWLNLRADVGATTYFSEIAVTQTLDNLRRDGTLGVIDYLERVPDKLIPRKDELIQSLKERAGFETVPVPGTPRAGGTLPDGELNALPSPARKAALYQRHMREGRRGDVR